MERYNLKEMQHRVYQNKLIKGFNVTDIEKEFCLLYGEVAEFYEAWRKKLPTVGEEIADAAIYLLGLAEILHIDMEEEILRKMERNEKRTYKIIDGVNTRIPDDNPERKIVDCTILHERLIDAIRNDSWQNFQLEMIDEFTKYKVLEFSRLFTLKDKAATQEMITVLILRCCDAGVTVIIRDDISTDAFTEFRRNLRKEIKEGKVIIDPAE